VFGLSEAMVQLRCTSGTGSMHVTDGCKPGMPQICQQLMKREAERERDGLTHFLLPWIMGVAECSSVLSEVSVRAKERRSDMGRE